jgi:hypothetical protein
MMVTQWQHVMMLVKLCMVVGVVVSLFKSAVLLRSLAASVCWFGVEGFWYLDSPCLR